MIYAISSLNAYSDGSKNGFELAKLSPEWKQMNKVGGLPKHGLSYSYFFRESPDKLEVLVAFRGTEVSDVGDWWANFSWFTRPFGFKDEYDYAREEFSKIRQQAIGLAKGRLISYIATGHSLGGGLAQHVAYSFPCTSAAVFNTSPVVNKDRLKAPYDTHIVLIYENNDELTKIKKYLFGDNETELYKYYNMNLIPDKKFQHPMEGLAVGMARLVADCQTRSDCEIKKDDSFARRAYCSTYGTYGPDELCKNIP